MESKPLHHDESFWSAPRRLACAALSSVARDWLLDSSSLTRRLQAACADAFTVQIISQKRERPFLSEQRKLRMRDGERALVRHVYLLCGQTPWVFARTVIPVRTLTGNRRLLSRLGTRPLGEILFSDPHCEREPMEIAHVRPGERLFSFAVRATGGCASSVWGRRSLFRLAGRPLLVSELFLPGENPWTDLTSER